MQIDEDIMADSLNVLSLYTNQRKHIVQCNDMQEIAITNRYYGEQTSVLFLNQAEQLQLFGSYLFG